MSDKMKSVYDYSINAKYSHDENEGWEQISERVAITLAQPETQAQSFWTDKFFNVLKHKFFLPGGRILANAGRLKQNMFNCLSGNTKVLTREFGPIKLRDIVGTQVYLLDGRGDWVKSKILSFGNQKLVTLNFGVEGESNNVSFTVDATYDHMWITPSGRIPTSELKIGTRLPIVYGNRETNNTREYTKGILHGFVYGDGSKRSNNTGYQVRIPNTSKDILHYFEEHSMSRPPSCNGDFVISISGKWDKNHWIRQTPLKELPKNKTNDYLTGFFRGWFAADGCVDPKGYPSICVGKKEEEWIRHNIVQLGYYFGKGSSLAKSTNFGPRKKDSRNLYIKRYSFTKHDCLLQKHRDRVNSTVGNDFIFKGIKHNSERVEKVFCAVVPTTHSFTLGTGLLTSNCYIKDIQDSIKGPDGWADTLATTTEIMAMGGGVGLSFDKVRPREATIKGVGGNTNGSVAFMRTIDGLKYSISGGQNRGIALLFGQALNHPDILEFLQSKEQDGIISAANISVLIDDAEEFVNHIDDPDYQIELIHGGKVHRKVKLCTIVDLALDNMLKNGEAGFLNRDLMNIDSTTYNIGPIVCTNPCGELPHIADGCCDLGSIDIAKFVFPSSGRVNWNLLKDIVRTAVRMLDNAYDVTVWPTEKVKYTNQRLRKLGLGIMGAHHFLIKRGVKYSDMERAGEMLAEVMKVITTTAYWESIELAKEKGQFEALDREKFVESGFVKKLPKKLRENILEFGIRNCNLTSIAPTGTISIAAHTSPSLEPCIARGMERRFNYQFKGKKIIFDKCNVIDPIWLEICDTDKAELFEEAADIGLENHLYIQAAVQPWVDSAVSKTVNFKPGEITRDDVKQLIKKYFTKLKGFTMLPAGSRKDAPQQPVSERTWRKWMETGDYITYGSGADCTSGKCDI